MGQRESIRVDLAAPGDATDKMRESLPNRGDGLLFFLSAQASFK